MYKQFNYYWRVFATGLSFFLFGFGGLLLRLIVFPLLILIIWNRQQRTKFARQIIRITFRIFIELMQLLGVLNYKIQGLSRLERKGLLILANHPTLIDTVFLMAFVKNADCIVKSALWRNPFTRGPIRAAGYICNANGSALINDCITSLRNGNNLIIFPEGTRTEFEGTIKLKRGAAHIAVRGMRNVTPVIIRCQPLTLTKGGKWWRVPFLKPHFKIEIREDILVKEFIMNVGDESLAARHLTQYLQDYLCKNLKKK